MQYSPANHNTALCPLPPTALEAEGHLGRGASWPDAGGRRHQIWKRVEKKFTAGVSLACFCSGHGRGREPPRTLPRVSSPP